MAWFHITNGWIIIVCWSFHSHILHKCLCILFCVSIEFHDVGNVTLMKFLNRVSLDSKKNQWASVHFKPGTSHSFPIAKCILALMRFSLITSIPNTFINSHYLVDQNATIRVFLSVCLSLFLSLSPFKISRFHSRWEKICGQKQNRIITSHIYWMISSRSSELTMRKWRKTHEVIQSKRVRADVHHHVQWICTLNSNVVMIAIFQTREYTEHFRIEVIKSSL